MTRDKISEEGALIRALCTYTQTQDVGLLYTHLYDYYYFIRGLKLELIYVKLFQENEMKYKTPIIMNYIG